MKILSVRQPWASLIVNGFKDVENRTWPTRYRGRILVHARSVRMIFAATISSGALASACRPSCCSAASSA
jgi:hypothetical protein